MSPELSSRIIAGTVGLSTAVQAFRLIRLALSIHRGEHSFGPCRGAGFLGMGVLVGGAAAVAGVLLGDPAVLAAGVVAATAMYLLGLLLLPGAAVTVAARLRRLLDGAAVGACLFYTAWLLVIAPNGGLVLLVGLVATAAASVALITGLRAVRYRPAALACASGVTLAVTALAWLSVDPGWPATVTLLAGQALTAAGAHRTGISQPDPSTADGSFAGYPVLALPLGAAVLATIYQLITAGVPDRTAITLSAFVAAAVGLREMLAALDVRRYARRLASREAHFRSLVAGSNDVTAVIDADLVVRWLSPAAARQFGLSDQDVLGRPFTALVHPADTDRVTDWLSGADGQVVEARLRDGYGQWRDTESTLRDLRTDPEVAALVVHIRDVGERRELQHNLRRMARTDQLTGLANRAELLRAERTGCLLVIDLDGVTGVNDTRGHELGDAVLIEAARRLRAGVDAADLPVRLGGDRFAVVTPTSTVRAYTLATRLVTILGEAYRLPGATVHLSASAGLAQLDGGTDMDEALRRADLARRGAERAGPGRVEWYDESMERIMARRMALEQELPGVVKRGELDLVYQPVIELAYQHPVGIESLLRWRHPRLGTIPPAEVIPVAEDLGVLDEIGEWVLHRACRQLSQWRREGWDLWMSVNVSTRQLVSPGFQPALRSALDSHLVEGSHLLIEVPGLDCAEARAALTAVHDLGVRTAIDRFGAGATPLSHLREMPIDVVKVDRSLFAELPGSDGPAAPIMDVVMGLGDRLGLEVIASGLEAEAHLEVVRNAGCRFGQGNLFAMPAPAEHVEAYLAAHRSPLF